MNVLAENGNHGIIYRIAVEDEAHDVLNFLRKHYYPEEPITNGNMPKHQDQADEEFSCSVIQYGVSIVAIDPAKNDKIVGAILVGPIQPNEAQDMLEESIRCECENKKWSEILQLLAYLCENSNVFKRYNVDRALHIHVLGVDTAYRGKSLGQNLMQKCFDVGKSLKYPLVTVDCTSVFSIRIAEKLQMECIHQVAFSDYKDKNGRQIFNPPSPHAYIKTFTKVL